MDKSDSLELVAKIQKNHELKRLYDQHRSLDEKVAKLARQRPVTPHSSTEMTRLKKQKARLKSELFHKAAGIE